MSIYNATSLSHKRKRNEHQFSEIDTRPFTIAANTFNTFSGDRLQSVRTFTPVCLLSRAQLPLVWLAPSKSTSSNSPGGIFVGNVPALAGSAEGKDKAFVLVATERSSSESEHGLYAVEHVDGSNLRRERARYALCQLGDWVDENMVLQRARQLPSFAGDERPAKRRNVHSFAEIPSAVWWRNAAVEVDVTSSTSAVELPTPPPALVFKALQPLQTLNLPRENEAARSNSGKHVDQADSGTVTSLAEEPSAEIAAAPTYQGMVTDLVTQYLTTLYLSRTSLAFFVKGPLSRARAACMPSPEDTNAASFGSSDLVAFLRSTLLISASSTDKKYRDCVPETLRNLGPRIPDAAPAMKKRKKAKLKRGKDGFLADERDYLEKWWHSEAECAASINIADADASKKQVDKIRDREAFLQILITLEILALEATSPPAVFANQEPVPVLEEGGAQQGNNTQTSKRKSSKAKCYDLPALLETLLDKLCIWHILGASSPHAKKVKGDDSQSLITQENEYSDELRNFCVEVIVPFYTSRIPLHAATVNQKLGGPSAPSPVSRKASGSVAKRPGQPASRLPTEQKSRRPLERVGTEILNRGRKGHLDRPPSLQRSATDSQTMLTATQVKREPADSRESSQTPHAAFQPAKLSRSNSQLQTGHSRQNSFVSELKHFGRREVDLTAISTANEIKARKKQDVEARLKEAVEGIRKPNRALAAAQVEREKSLLKDDGKSVAVTSTPFTRGKQRNAGPRTAQARSGVGSNGSGTSEVESSSPANEQYGGDIRLPMSTPAIPATSHRPRFASRTQNSDSNFARVNGLAGVQETPTRGFAKFMPIGLATQPGTLLTKESQVATGTVSTPSKKAPSQGTLLQVSTPHHTQVSPLWDRQLTPALNLSHSTPAKRMHPLVVASPNLIRAGKGAAAPSESEGRGDESAEDVYNSLGWNDDGYEPLA